MGHIDLFSGIGGFTLAAQWAGLTTEVFCENDKRCQDFLGRTYPGVPIIPDVRKFDGTRWRGRFLLTGGVPCQPASRAGKQRGRADDRWLWLEGIRVVGEAKPAWCLFENPPGIGDVGLAGILADLEAQDYEVRVIGVPACAVGSPQIRNRYWIVANSQEQRLEGWSNRSEGQPEKSVRFLSTGSSQGDLADTEATTGISLQDREEPESPPPDGRCNTNFWRNSVWLPCADGKVRRAPDDTFGVAHGLHRSILAGLGNSIVPQVAYQIIKAIKEASHVR